MLDFSRYLESDPDLEFIDDQMHKAYEEWSSYCYMAYSSGSGSSSASSLLPQSPSASPSGSASCLSPGSSSPEDSPTESVIWGERWENIDNDPYSSDPMSGFHFSSTHPSYTNCSLQQQDSHPLGYGPSQQNCGRHRDQTQAISLPHPYPTSIDPEYGDSDPESLQNAYVSLENENIGHVKFCIGSGSDLDIKRCNCDCDGSVCDTEGDINLERAETMPRPPGCGFGSRLTSVKGHGHGRVEGRGNPVLGVSGLTYNGSFNPLCSRKKNEDKFPKCVTNSFVRTSINGYRPSTLHHGTRHCDSIRTDLDITTHHEQADNCTKTTQCVSMSQSHVILSSLSDVIDDVINEVGSDDEEFEDEDEEVNDTFCQIPDSDNRKRRVSFADEVGEELVICHIFEKEESITGSLSPVSEDGTCDWSDEDVFSDDSDNEDIQTWTRDRKERIGLIAVNAYRRVNQDIERVKVILKQHREYFDNLLPQGDHHITGGDQPEALVPNILSEAEKEDPKDCDMQHNQDGDISLDMDNNSLAQSQPSGSDNDNCLRPDLGSSIFPTVINDNVTVDLSKHITSKRDTVPNWKLVPCNFEVGSEDILTTDLKDNIVRLDRSQIYLSNETSTVHGAIRVWNETNLEHLFIRYTTNKWDTFQDIPAQMTSECLDIDHNKLFSFWIPLPENDSTVIPASTDSVSSLPECDVLMSHDSSLPECDVTLTRDSPNPVTSLPVGDIAVSHDLDTPVLVEFAVCVTSDAGKIWDNNNGLNYCVQLVTV